MLAFSVPQRSCIGSMAYPSQPSSSPRALMKNTGNKVATSSNGIFGWGGSGTPIKYNIQYAKNNMAGAKKMIGTYHLLALILL
jgi:hypothetical protein